MKIKDGFVLKNVANSYIVVPLGSRVVDFSSIIKLNDTGAFLWNILSENNVSADYLLDRIIDEYDVDFDTAHADINRFIIKLKDTDLLE